jgi:YD repeat-containing protein
MMRETEYMYVYEFDEFGKLIRSFETRKDDGTKDTTSNVYMYDQNDRLLEHKKGDGKGFTSSMYEYDEKGRITRESYVREYKDSAGVDQRTILNSETMKYEEFDHQTKKTVFNSYGLPYMYEFSYYNELGYLTHRVERLIMTMAETTYKYTYDEKGFIASIGSFVNGNDVATEEYKYMYDDNGNLLEKHLYRNGVYNTEIEMIYNDKSKLLTYVLTRDVATNFIMILSFKDYQFY